MTEAAQNARAIRAKQDRRIASKGGVLYARDAREIQAERQEDELEKARRLIEAETRREQQRLEAEYEKAEREVTKSINAVDREIRQEAEEIQRQQRQQDTEQAREEAVIRRGWDTSINQYDRQLRRQETSLEKAREKAKKEAEKRRLKDTEKARKQRVEDDSQNNRKLDKAGGQDGPTSSGQATFQPLASLPTTTRTRTVRLTWKAQNLPTTPLGKRKR
jgi:hypothetical protein